MIKLKQLCAYDIVTFRCGGKATVVIVDIGRQCNEVLFLEFPELIFEYDDVGSYGDMHPLDIVEITQPPFDWPTAQAGMAFIKGGEVWFFMSHSLVAKDNARTEGYLHDGGAYFQKSDNLSGVSWISYSHLIRAPEEQDMKVVPK